MIYGHDKTIHRTKLLNIEVDKRGEVVAVWFRCVMLPFDVTVVGQQRAAEMRVTEVTNPPLPILAVRLDESRGAEDPCLRCGERHFFERCRDEIR